MKQQQGNTQFAIEDHDDRGKVGRVWLRKFADVFVPLGHIACILEDARRVYPSPLSREVQAWWERVLNSDEPIPVYNPLLEEKEWKKSHDRHGERRAPGILVTGYDHEEMKDLVEAFEFAEMS